MEDIAGMLGTSGVAIIESSGDGGDRVPGEDEP